MRLKIKNPQDFWCGLFFIGLGAVAIYQSRAYAMGSALAMGPGYFPTWLGGIMIGFGVVIGALSFKLEGDPHERAELRDWAFRPWLVLTAAIAIYAVLMEATSASCPRSWCWSSAVRSPIRT